MLRVTVCVSGGGTNLQAIIDRIQDGTIRNARIVQVISNNPGAYALERAAKAGIEGCCVSPRDYPDRETFNDALLARINEAAPDLIVLAGFMVAVPVQICRAYAGKIINIHPALIPSFCGPGCYGLHVHEKALAYGVKLSGATVHFVSEECDGGPIILQKAVDVLPDDTPEVLQRRIMEQCEWKIMPQAVSLFCQDKLQVEGRVVRILP
jgi:phosphoribosylglycinamide formyltransferase-1